MVFLVPMPLHGCLGVEMTTAMHPEPRSWTIKIGLKGIVFIGYGGL
jgi:hypothetical protein